MSNKRRLVEYPLDEHSSVFIESLVDYEDDATAESLVSDEGEQLLKSRLRLDSMLTQIKPTIEAIHSSLTDINNPAEIELEVGLDLKVGAGVVFASAESNCTFKLRFKWVNP